jgi:putative membrane protein
MGNSGEKRYATAEEFKVRLQMESTLLVWVRTSLSLMGFGFVIARFGFFLREIAQAGAIHMTPHPHLATANNITGSTLIGLGVIVMLCSLYSHRQMVTQLEQGQLALPSRWSLAVLVSLIVAGLGVAMAVYLTIITL